MGRLILRWILLAVSVYAASLLTQAFGLGFQVKVGTFGDVLTLLLGVAVLAFLNATVGKILKLMTLPLNCMTLGLMSLVINALVLILAASLELGFTFTSGGFMKFVAAFVASLLIAFINGVLGTFLPDKEDE